MQKVDVCYANNKDGTYVQFMLPVNATELGELDAYDKCLRRNIKQDFAVLFDTYAMDFTTDKSYVVPRGGLINLILCLQGDTSPELEDTLGRIGVERRMLNIGLE